MKDCIKEFNKQICDAINTASMDELNGMCTALRLVSSLFIDTHAQMVEDNELIPAYVFKIQHAIVEAYRDAADAACRRIQTMHAYLEEGANK